MATAEANQVETVALKWRVVLTLTPGEAQKLSDGKVTAEVALALETALAVVPASDQ